MLLCFWWRQWTMSALSAIASAAFTWLFTVLPLTHTHRLINPRTHARKEGTEPAQQLRGFQPPTRTNVLFPSSSSHQTQGPQVLLLPERHPLSAWLPQALHLLFFFFPPSSSSIPKFTSFPVHFLHDSSPKPLYSVTLFILGRGYSKIEESEELTSQGIFVGFSAWDNF